MNQTEMKLDALLITATGRLMRAAAVTGELRAAIITKDAETAARASRELGEHLEIAGATFDEVRKITGAHRAAQRVTERTAVQ